MKIDPWGEPIPASRRSFPLAALFRGMTLTALLLGAIGLSNADPIISGGVFAAVAAALSAVIHQRHPGTWMSKLAAASLFALGFMLVAFYVWGLAGLFAAPGSKAPAEDILAAMFGGCWALFAFPIALAIGLLLVRRWVSLANRAGERPLAEVTNSI
jgi:hypothetical protein